ncbi:MAG TPA: methylated-DNA--[protein]-cysteine S-methyltransferase [Acidimicrobiia bacterium]|jgi:O-6-methylguanine DNA methyltransferase|nr:methylated-DNA--[protein]-cysteine S-methyltransferase [Acidimicrobiia bacterium]
MTIESQLEMLLAEPPAGISEGVALGTGIAHGYDIYESAIGEVVVTFNTVGVSSVDIVDGFAERFTRRFGKGLIRADAPAAWRHHIPEAIDRGTPGKLPLDLSSVTGFQTEVLMTTATIPKGEVRPYGWVAKEIHRPGAVRAVGSAVARNPVPLIVPCHRVVRTDGHIGNYSLGGPHFKVELLEHEGARPTVLEELATRNIRVRGDVASGVYHHPTCGELRRARGETTDFRSTAAAETAGLTPCPVCRPMG